MANKILVTGSSGYIGQHLLQILKGKGYELHGIDLKENVTNLDKFFQLDIRNPVTLTDEYHTIIHLAALVNVGESVNDPEGYYATNLYGTANVLKNIKHKNFVFSSTGAAEKCESPYGVSKRAAEDIVQHFCKNSRYTIFRFYNVIGSDGISPTNADGLYFNLIKAVDTDKFTIYGNDYNTKDGTCVRDYVHVNEICYALERAISESSTSIENLGHGQGHTVKEIVEIFKTVNNVDFKVEYGSRRSGDIETSVLSNVSKFIKHYYTFNELLRYK